MTDGAPAETPTERIDLEFPQEAPLQFGDFDQLKGWLVEERKFWGWVNIAGHPMGIQELWNTPNKLWGTIDSAINDYRNTQEADEETRRKHREIVDSRLRQLYEAPIMFRSSDPRAQYVKEIRDRDGDAVAVITLHVLIRPDGNLPKHELMWAQRGTFLALMFREGGSRRVDAEADGLNAVRDRWGDFLRNSEAAYFEFQSDYRELRDAINEKDNEISTLRDDQVKAFQSLVEQSEEKLAALRELYNNELAVRAPVDYWNDRAQASRLGACFWAACFVGNMYLIWRFLGAKFHNLVFPVPEPAAALSDGTSPQYWQVILIVLVVGSFAIWPLRIFSRLFLSSMHVFADARERTTMALTYLALLQEDVETVKGERKVILEALFRPSRYGIVKDDAAPPSLIKVASDLSGGGRSPS